jgi:hypothetical protein
MYLDELVCVEVEGLFLASSLLLDLTDLGGPARSLISRRYRSRDHEEY